MLYLDPGVPVPVLPASPVTAGLLVPVLKCNATFEPAGDTLK